MSAYKDRATDAEYGSLLDATFLEIKNAESWKVSLCTAPCGTEPETPGNGADAMERDQAGA